MMKDGVTEQKNRDDSFPNVELKATFLETFPRLTHRQPNENAFTYLTTQFATLNFTPSKPALPNKRSFPTLEHFEPLMVSGSESSLSSRSSQESPLIARSSQELFLQDLTPTSSYSSERSTDISYGSLTPHSSDRSSGSSSSPHLDSGDISEVKADIPLTIDTLRTGNLEALKNYLTQGGDPDILLDAKRSLMTCAFLTATNRDEKTPQQKQYQENQFFLLLPFAKIMQVNEKKSLIHYVNKNSKARISLLHKAYTMLCKEVPSILEIAQRNLDELDTQFECALYQAGLQEWQSFTSKKFEDIGFKPAAEKEEDIALILWNMCSCITTKEQINKEYLCDMVQGLLSVYSPATLLILIQKLWPDFEEKQKLIALFIIKELVSTNIYHQHNTKEEETLEQINSLQNSCLKELPCAETFSALLTMMLTERKKLRDNVVYFNYCTLRQWSTHPAFCKEKSFKTLVMRAIRSKRQEQYIEDIAAELRTMTLILYQQISVDEFYHIGRSGKDKEQTSPHISQQQKLVNNLSFFIQSLILTQKNTDNITKLIRLFVLVAKKLCTTTDNLIGPDFCSFFFIMAALNSAVIIRLKNCFSELSEETLETFQLLDKLANLDLLSKAESSYPAPLPHIGVSLRLLTHLSEVNIKGSCRSLGKLFRQYLQLQRNLSPSSQQVQTNIFALLDETYLTEEQMYDLSLRLFNPTLSLNNQSISQIKETLDAYMQKQIFPIISFNEKEYKINKKNVEEILALITKYLTICLRKSQIYQQDLNTAKDLIFNLISFINEKYTHNKLNAFAYFNEHIIGVVSPAPHLLLDQLNISQLDQAFNDSLKKHIFPVFSVNGKEYSLCAKTVDEILNFIIAHLKKCLSQLDSARSKADLKIAKTIVTNIVNFINQNHFDKKLNLSYLLQQISLPKREDEETLSRATPKTLSLMEDKKPTFPAEDQESLPTRSTSLFVESPIVPRRSRTLTQSHSEKGLNRLSALFRTPTKKRKDDTCSLVEETEEKISLTDNEGMLPPNAEKETHQIILFSEILKSPRRNSKASLEKKRDSLSRRGSVLRWGKKST